MGFEVPLLRYSYNASVDLTGSGYRAVTINADGELALPAAGGQIIGVLQNEPDVGEAGSVEHLGISFAEVSAAVSAGDDLEVGADGRFATATTGNAIVATALEDASGAGSVIAVLLGWKGDAA